MSAAAARGRRSPPALSAAALRNSRALGTFRHRARRFPCRLTKFLVCPGTVLHCPGVCPKKQKSRPGRSPAHLCGDAGRGGQPLPVPSAENPMGEVWRAETLQMKSAAADSQKPHGGGLEGRSPPNAIRTRRHARRVRKPCAARFPCTFPRPRLRRRGNVSCRKRPAAPAFSDKLERLQAASAIMFRPCALRTGT